MFGERHRGPGPSRHEPFILLALSILIAAGLILAYAGITYFFDRLQQAGP